MTTGRGRVGRQADNTAAIGEDDLKLFVFGIPFLEGSFQLDNGQDATTATDTVHAGRLLATPEQA